MTEGQPPAPPPAPPPQQLVDRDDEHLRMLSICHYVLAGINALFACIPIIHVGMGTIFILMPPKGGAGGGPPPQLFGWIFVIIGAAAILIGWTIALLVAYAGRCLKERRRHTLCFVVACLMLMSFPLGTVLGVFSLMVLSRPSVKASFEAVKRQEALEA